ncbi:hypothetical protein L211DRAFT_230014 [Terfezia boudieri ATCC MYA-4762]|uniref:Uncharacterized protein n=1 Tax=Terfezia boudieri ATCC MYA-4762 TaxID=1051890 RepID=A0A3N4LQH7_9PEZI|nr:hypothetical protein L211DRAFT_230014 [Terfezia boudieri ATCC MYA-4762]
MSKTVCNCIHRDMILLDLGPGSFFLRSEPSEDCSQRMQSRNLGLAGGASTKSDSGHPEYFIHKTLLSSLSTEFHKHVNNDMKQGGRS